MVLCSNGGVTFLKLAQHDNTFSLIFFSDEYILTISNALFAVILSLFY